jgi:hypothetical protein
MKWYNEYNVLQQKLNLRDKFKEKFSKADLKILEAQDEKLKFSNKG